MSDVMMKYYAQRANNYEQIYKEPQIQDDLHFLIDRVSSTLDGHDVLELGCGTGFWTEKIAKTAASVCATDINQVMLDFASAKSYPEKNVAFKLADMFALKPTEDAEDAEYSACFAGFMWSHVKRENYGKMLNEIRAVVGAGGLLVLIDDNDVEGRTLPIARTDIEGNVFQFREQAGAERVEIMKNYPTDSYMRKRFAAAAKEIRIVRNAHYWMLTCILK
jgi:ubiquinone/menaquinone biosynthesis C-methylase UbiE